MRTILALGLTSVLVATTCAQMVLGNGNGGVRAVNALATAEQPEQPLQWSRRNFTDNTNSQIFGFFPAYTIRSDDVLFDFFGNNMGFGGATTPVTITTVDSLVNNFGWPTSFTVPQYLFRQGGAYTNENGFQGNRQLYGPVWIKYELDDSNPNGWNVVKVQVFAWDVRDITHKSSGTKTRSFSDTAAPYQIDIYVAQNDPNPASAPQNDTINWTFVGTLSKAEGTLPNVCEWNPNTGNTFGECSQAVLDYLNGNNSLNLKFYQDPTNDIWYSTLNVSGQSGIKYVALVIPQGNQYINDPNLRASDRVANSLRYTNITDVRVIAQVGPEGDVNGDGCVDDADLLIVLFNFGNAGGQGDVNNDNIVDDADLLIVLFNFGAGC
jgi:hypothetical protein